MGRYPIGFTYTDIKIIFKIFIFRGSPVPAVTPTRGLHTPSVIDRATSSVGSLTEYESVHSDVYREHVVSGKYNSNNFKNYLIIVNII